MAATDCCPEQNLNQNYCCSTHFSTRNTDYFWNEIFDLCFPETHVWNRHMESRGRKSCTYLTSHLDCPKHLSALSPLPPLIQGDKLNSLAKYDGRHHLLIRISEAANTMLRRIDVCHIFSYSNTLWSTWGVTSFNGYWNRGTLGAEEH